VLVVNKSTFGLFWPTANRDTIHVSDGASPTRISRDGPKRTPVLEQPWLGRHKRRRAVPRHPPVQRQRRPRPAGQRPRIL